MSVKRAPRVIIAPTDWDLRFLLLSRMIASWSKDPSSKIGAVIVRPNKTIVSLGFNGFPRGVKDYPERYEDRFFKLNVIIHAEMNAILSASENLFGTTIYITHPPCSKCSSMMIQKGIRRVIVIEPDDEFDERWKDAIDLSLEIIEEAGAEMLFVKRKVLNRYFS